MEGWVGSEQDPEKGGEQKRVVEDEIFTGSGVSLGRTRGEKF